MYLAIFFLVSLTFSAPIEPEDLANHGPKFISCVEKWMEKESLGKASLHLIEYLETVI